jgi:hypothetical protein
LNPEVLRVSVARAWGSTTPRPSRAQMVVRISSPGSIWSRGRVRTDYQAILVEIAREDMNEVETRGLRRVFEVSKRGPEIIVARKTQQGQPTRKGRKKVKIKRLDEIEMVEL